MAYPVTFEEVLGIMSGMLPNSLLEDMPTRTQDFIFAKVDLQVDQAKWGDMYKYGFAYLAAHGFALAVDRAAGSGTLSSESLGELSQGFTMPVNNPDAKNGLLSTQYGREYADLRDTAIASIDVL